jgi:putative RNA 2'-phosphotransferase
MISDRDAKHISKFMSMVLRHQPQMINIVLDENGWTDTDVLIKKMNEQGFSLTKEILRYVVQTNNKKRFAFNEDETRIRASQGHSIEIDLDYSAAEPPAFLYHGTALAAVESILQSGLDKRERHHVHLSKDVQTALQVGRRRGKAQLLRVEALAMFKDGYRFFLSENGVWLTDHVPVKYISVIELPDENHNLQ